MKKVWYYSSWKHRQLEMVDIYHHNFKLNTLSLHSLNLIVFVFKSFEIREFRSQVIRGWDKIIKTNIFYILRTLQNKRKGGTIIICNLCLIKCFSWWSLCYSFIFISSWYRPNVFCFFNCPSHTNISRHFEATGYWKEWLGSTTEPQNNTCTSIRLKNI